MRVYTNLKAFQDIRGLLI